MDCDEEREGYLNPTRPAYPPIHSPVHPSRRSHHSLTHRGEEALGGLITIAGGAWAVYVVAFANGTIWQLQFTPPGPLEICSLGILIWLHAKWRHSAHSN